jgi:hypothetical protein
MMFHHRGQNNVSIFKGKSLRKVIDRFGCIPAEENDIMFRRSIDKPVDIFSRFFEGPGRQPGFVPGAPVDITVPAGEFIDGVEHQSQCGRRRRVIEVYIRSHTAAHDWHLFVHADEEMAERFFCHIRVNHDILIPQFLSSSFVNQYALSFQTKFI